MACYASFARTWPCAPIRRQDHVTTGDPVLESSLLPSQDWRWWSKIEDLGVVHRVRGREYLAMRAKRVEHWVESATQIAILIAVAALVFLLLVRTSGL